MNPDLRLVVSLGMMLFGAGVMGYFGQRWLRVGRFPSAQAMERPGIRIYFPLMTALLASAALAAMLLVLGATPS